MAKSFRRRKRRILGRLSGNIPNRERRALPLFEFFSYARAARGIAKVCENVSGVLPLL
jgi:hypothetical protein